MSEWRTVPDTGGYVEVSASGEVRGVQRRPLKTNKTTDGYRRMTCTIGPKKLKAFFIHRLVAMAFIGPIPEGYEVNHIDGNKENNALENLEYVTRRQNIQHAIQTLGRDWKSPKNAGGTHGMAKLTETDVVRLRTLHAEGWRLPRLAQEFGVGIASVSMIVNRKTWRHI